MAPSTFPDYDNIPPVEGMPKGCAWNLFNKDGKKDLYGCLNKITPDAIREAVAEVKDAVSISLNWPLGALKVAGYGRKGVKHNVIDFQDVYKIHGWDDELEFNTQCSSQWDGLCHFYHQDLKCGYNGVRPTMEELVQDYGHEDTSKSLPTLNQWHDRGGLVGRGVLIDYKAYAEANGITYSPYDNHTITIAEIEKIAKLQGVIFKPGDVLLVRSGYTDELTDADPQDQQRKMNTGKSVGVEANDESVKWFWNQHFAAVAGDTVAFEVQPPAKGGPLDLFLHPNFLTLFGLCIGELWDLKALSEYCGRTKRYTFLLTSIPMNVGGLVGSPPNALAIF